MTLALLLTAVTGAWATDVYVVGNGTGNWVNGAIWDPGVAGNKMTEQNGVYSITFTNVDANSELLFKFAINGTWDVNYGCISTDANELNKTLSNIDATGGMNFMFGLTEKADVTISFNLSEMTYMISTKGMKVGDDAPDVEVTTNAASEQDLFTEAKFNMPTFDVDVNYMLVRDMQDQANPVAFSGLPSSGNIVVKKGDDGKYQPAEALTIQLIDPLAAAEAQNIIGAEGITVKVLVGNGGTPIEYDQENPITLEAFLADMKPGYYWIKAEPTDENSLYDGTVYSSEFTAVEQYDLTVKPADEYSKGKLDNVTVGSESVTIDATTGKVTKTGIDPDTEVKLKAKRGYVIEKVEAKKTVIPMLNAATTENIGMVVCNKGHLHDAKTAVPAGCTAVGIVGKVTGTGHGLILALKNATNQNWNTINGWTSVTTYAGTTLKVLPDDAARGTNLTSYTTLGETTVSNWAVAQKSDYVTIFTNLGSTKNSGGMTYDNNVNAYITAGVGGTAMAGDYWSATPDDDYDAWYFHDSSWYDEYNTSTFYVRPVLGF